MRPIFLCWLDQRTIGTIKHKLIAVWVLMAQYLRSCHILSLLFRVDFTILPDIMLSLILFLSIYLLFQSFLTVLLKILVLSLTFILTLVLLLVFNIFEILLGIPCLQLLNWLLSWMTFLIPLPALYLVSRRILLQRILQHVSPIFKALEFSRSDWCVILRFNLIFLYLTLRCSGNKHLLHIILLNCFYYNYISNFE